MISEPLLRRIEETCRNIYTVNLHSDTLEQKGQI